MRIGHSLSLLAAASALALAGCGGGSSGTENATMNSPPLISGNPATTLTVGSAYNFQPTAADPDGDKITFSAQNLPAWLAIDSSTGHVTGTPKTSDVGMSGMITIE